MGTARKRLVPIERCFVDEFSIFIPVYCGAGRRQVPESGTIATSGGAGFGWHEGKLYTESLNIGRKISGPPV